AEVVNKKVRLSWTTASEINNDYFTVERAGKDLDQFDFIAKVNSYMNNSTVMLNYEAWDEQPLSGLQYYRLKQTDLDGQSSFSELRPVYFGDGKSFEITNVYGFTQDNGQFQVEFLYDSELPLSVLITDATGRVLYTEDGLSATPGLNKIYLSQNLPRGIYFVILQNQENKVNRKFFY
ncbi:MAG: T9SS type A sorting domain-containing protein, partial [Bacteroidia bacterium]|nr:T9SS type A sorting domain-containing protein [Bacteroidia bacterium]